MSVPSPQTRMLSPSSTRAQPRAWVRGLLQTWVSPPVTKTARPSCGSGVQATGSSMWPRPSAWRWTSAPRHYPWSTVAPASCCGGVAWMGLFTLFIKWAWRSARAKSPPNGTLMTPGWEEDPRKTSARGCTMVSLVSFVLSERENAYILYSTVDLMLSIMELWGLSNAWGNYQSRNESNVKFSLCLLENPLPLLNLVTCCSLVYL